MVLVQPRISNGRTFQNPCSPGVQRPVLRHVVCMIRLIKKVDRKKKLQKMLPWASFSFDRKPRCAMSAPLWLPAFPFPFICGFMGTHCRLLQFARVCICSSGGRRRPYRVECTGSLSTSEVKQHRARLVLGWGTAWEDLWVLSACCTTKKRQGTVMSAERQSSRQTSTLYKHHYSTLAPRAVTSDFCEAWPSESCVTRYMSVRTAVTVLRGRFPAKESGAHR